jgi:addiction module RelE/StbE family toxin
MFTPAFNPDVDKKIFKLKRRDSVRFEQIKRKINEICENPYHYKPLSGEMHGERRVHIGHYVLTYELDEEQQVVRILDYNHHEHVYEKD